MSKSGLDWEAIKAKRAGNLEVQAGYAEAKLAFELGQRVRSLREKRGLTQKELGRLADMTQSAVARFEAGWTTPTLAVVNRLAQALGMTVSIQLKPSKVA